MITFSIFDRVARPISEEEKRLTTPSVVSCNESRREVSVTHKNVINKHVDRTFTFDKVKVA